VGAARCKHSKPYLTESVHKIVLQKSISTQIRQLIFCISNNEGQVDGFVGELILAKRLYTYFLLDENPQPGARPRGAPGRSSTSNLISQKVVIKLVYKKQLSHKSVNLSFSLVARLR